MILWKNRLISITLIVFILTFNLPILINTHWNWVSWIHLTAMIFGLGVAVYIWFKLGRIQ